MRQDLLLAAVTVIAAAGLAGYGIWSREHDLTVLRQHAADTIAPRVAVVNAKPAPAEETLTLPGQATAWNEAQIYAQVSGYIGHWFADYGAHVMAGQELATIHTPSLDAQYEASIAQLKVAQADANIAETTAKRFDALKGTGYETEQTIDNKDADALAKEATVASAQENVDHYKAMLGFKHIVAPFDGVITARRVNVGDFIGANGADDTRGSANGQAPFAIGDVTKLRVFVSVPQNLTRVLKPGLKAVLHSLSDPAKDIPAQLLAEAGAVQTATRTMTTEFEVDDPSASGLVPGDYVDATLTYPGQSNQFTIPSQAVLYRSEGAEVAVVDKDEKVRLRNVMLGRDLGLNVEIVSGISANDRIVADPSLGLLDGEIVNVVQPVHGYEPVTNDQPQVSAEQTAKSAVNQSPSSVIQTKDADTASTVQDR